MAKTSLHMKHMILLVSLLWAGTALAQGSALQVTVERTAFQPGDTLRFTAKHAEWKAQKKSGTMNVYMEDVDHQTYWRLRYPVLEGEAVGDLVLPASMPANYYALHFSLQDDFFAVSGRVTSDYKDKAIKVTVMLADKQLLSENISLDQNKAFAMKKMLFADQAKFFFAPARANRTNDLQVELQVSLDSSFQPIADTMTLVTIGTPPVATPPAGYRFNPLLFGDNEEGTLKSVEVIARRKTPAEKFEEERVTGLFRSPDAVSFDGTESNQFIGWSNILDWLKGRVAGLTVQPAGDAVNYNLIWQGGQTILFLNEMQVDAQTLTMVPMADIAYVKVMRPPFYGAYLGGAGGAVCVYTKDGSNGIFNGPRHSFVVNGYTPETFKLPIKGR